MIVNCDGLEPRENGASLRSATEKRRKVADGFRVILFLEFCLDDFLGEEIIVLLLLFFFLGGPY